jgi:hypothetical protein
MWLLIPVSQQLFHLVFKFLVHQSEQGTDSVFKRAFSVICLAALATRPEGTGLGPRALPDTTGKWLDLSAR